MEKKATITDVAKRAGVSVSTVSRVINNRKNVNPEIVEKVTAAITALHYIPNNNARNIRTGNSDCLSIVIPTVQTSLFSLILQGVMDATFEQGMRLLAYQSNGDVSTDLECLNSVAASHAGGLVYCPVATVEDSHLQTIFARGIPTVIVARRGTTPNVPHVYMDNIKGCYTATKYLLQLGRRRIAFFIGTWDDMDQSVEHMLSLMDSPIRGAYACLDRLQGHINALADFGIEFDKSLLMITRFDYKSGYQQMKRFLAKLIPFDALICANDWVAAGAMQALLEQNIQVPEQVSIIGYDDGDAPQIARPTLTSVRQSSYELGRCAVDCLLKAMDGEPTPDVVLESTLSIRNSTAKKSVL